MIEDLFCNVDKDELLELWSNYVNDEEKIRKFVSTNIRHANIALNSVLESKEKQFLEKLFFADTGWYRRINGEGMVRLKLAAMSLGLTNNIFTFDQAMEKEILKKSYPITQIFAGNRSTFKNKAHNIYTHNGFYVRREHEMIVENIAEQYECNNNVYVCIDRDIY